MSRKNVSFCLRKFQNICGLPVLDAFIYIMLFLSLSCKLGGLRNLCVSVGGVVSRGGRGRWNGAYGGQLYIDIYKLRGSRVLSNLLRCWYVASNACRLKFSGQLESSAMQGYDVCCSSGVAATSNVRSFGQSSKPIGLELFIVRAVEKYWRAYGVLTVLKTSHANSIHTSHTSASPGCHC